MRNYANSIIYKLCCNNSDIADIYIGSTTNFVKRKQQHKSVCNNTNNKRHTVNVYQFIRANGGWDSWNMVEVERYNAIDKRNLETRERYWLETLKATLNRVIPTRTKQEWIEDNKTELADNKKQYYIDNKQEFLEKQKQFYTDNKIEILEQRKQYCIDNKTEIAEKKKQYYVDNKTEILEKANKKITCLCGAITSICKKNRHMKTKKYDFAHNLHTFIYL